jgi:hypothetical protein
MLKGFPKKTGLKGIRKPSVFEKIGELKLKDIEEVGNRQKSGNIHVKGDFRVGEAAAPETVMIEQII